MQEVAAVFFYDQGSAAQGKEGGGVEKMWGKEWG